MTDSAPPGDRLAEAAALAEEIRERNRLVPDDDPRKVLLGHLDWLVGEVERLRALLEPSVIVSPPPAPDPVNDEGALPSGRAPCAHADERADATPGNANDPPPVGRGS